MEFVKLFQPITINKMDVKNRIVMPAMGLSFTDKYEFNDRYRGFYRVRARGGVGLMTIGPVAIDKVGSAPFLPALFSDDQVEPLQAFIEELHRDTDVKVGTQLFHMGRYSYSHFFGETPIAPSAVFCKMTGATPREMTLEDIEQIQDAFAQAARRAKEAGFDYIEAVGCTGYLISQFLSPVTNRREDQYGGSLENRMRFGQEVIQKMRQAVGPDQAIGMRIAGHDFMDGGSTNIEAAAFAKALEEAGADAINVTGGWHETNVPQLTTNVPPGVFTYLARGIRDNLSIPVFASNRLGDPEVAEKALRSGAGDMICWGRPLIADPELPNKVKEGRLDEIVYCIACNQGCFDSIFSGTSVHCILNPEAGMENEYRLEKASTPKKILVAGGGPAGMEFALTAAKRGHDVTLMEKSNRLGGQINLAKSPPGKTEFQNAIDSLEKRMAAYGVKVELGREVTPEVVSEMKPDTVVVATGAYPIDLKVPGWDKPHVIGAWDVLDGKVGDIGDNVVVIGGSATGCETAHYIGALSQLDPEAFSFLMYHSAEDPNLVGRLLHDSRKTITVIDMVDKLAANVGKTGRWSLMKSLRMSGINMMPSAKLVEITDTAVVADIGDKRETIPADTVVMAVGSRSDNDLAQKLENTGVKIITIGDAQSPRKITDAVREGFVEALGV
jgi:2,4-dienoyl-CoA reductase (NADPH2)